MAHKAKKSRTQDVPGAKWLGFGALTAKAQVQSLVRN